MIALKERASASADRAAQALDELRLERKRALVLEPSKIVGFVLVDVGPYSSK